LFIAKMIPFALAIRFGTAMSTKRAALAPETQSRRDQATRLKRFAKQFERWCRGEPVNSYETKWLAYLKEHRLEARQPPRRT
jgi:Ni/Co efflux regulator RcnB